MLVIASRTGNGRYIASKIDCSMALSIHDKIPDEPFLLITYTDLLGAAPEETMSFLRKHWRQCKGAIVTGNTNFGKNFAKAAEVIASCFDIPTVCKVDLRGNSEDYKHIQQYYDEKVKANGEILTTK